LVSEKGAWGISGNGGCSSIITGSKLLVEKKNKHVISAREVESLGKFERESLVVSDVAGRGYVWDQVVFLDVDGEDMASSVDDDHTIGGSVPGSNKAQLVCDLLSVEESGRGNFIHEEETHLGDDEEDTILWAILHQHWEVTLLLHLQVRRSLDLLLAGGWVADFHDVDFLGVFASFLLAEAEERVLVLGCICDWHISESGCETLKDLLLSLFDEEKLHVAANGLSGSLVDTNQVAPFPGCIDSVVHDLASAELGLLLENLLWGIGLVNVSVINIGLSDDTKGIFVDPSPEPNGLIDLALLHFGLGIKVKDLNDSFGSLGGSQGDNVL